MPQKPRPHRVQVKLDRQEYETLVARAAVLGTTKSQVVRDALRRPVDDVMPAAGELCREEALELLAAQAREGSAVAAAALARELRLQPVESGRPTVTGVVRLRDLPPGVLRAVE